MIARIDRVLVVLTWVAAAFVALALFAGPKLIGAEKETAGAPAAGAAPAGETVFAANCASCHTLAAAGATGAVGPNLDELKPEAATAKATVTAGSGSMPSFKDRLPAADIAAVAEYVATSAGG